MKTTNVLCAVLFGAAMIFQLTVIAQPSGMTFNNSTPASTIKAVAYAKDTASGCGGSSICISGPIVITGGTTGAFTPCGPSSYAWIGVKVWDPTCITPPPPATVGSACGFGPGPATFTDCSLNSYNLTWVGGNPIVQ